MKATERVLRLEDIDCTVVRKDVKHVRISVHPEGLVRVSAPFRVGDEALRRMLAPRLPWIRRKLADVLAREPQPRPEYVTGERHHFRGRQYRLQVTEGPGAAGVRLLDDETIAMRVPVGASRERREAVLEQWYRRQLAEVVEPLRQEWESRLGVRASEVRIRRMKTRWGSCNTRARRIWLNLELIKRSDACLEYVVVHELVHLLEGSHNARFWAFMDQFLPHWRQQRSALKRQA